MHRNLPRVNPAPTFSGTAAPLPPARKFTFTKRP